MKRYTIIAMLLAAALVLWVASPAIADEVTITGEVTDNNQIVTSDGEVYNISQNEQGDALMDHVGETVEAKGTLMENEDGKTISITEFKVMDQ